MFVAGPGNADLKAVADHVEHIAKIAGKKHVGLGSDYDGAFYFYRNRRVHGGSENEQASTAPRLASKTCLSTLHW